MADVSRLEDVERIAAVAQQTFGGFDTWVNNAGIGMYGYLEELAIDGRLFDVNFWGVVYGSRVAVAHLRGQGGTLINVGSVVSEQAIPLQGWIRRLSMPSKALPTRCGWSWSMRVRPSRSR